ncbi:hypothetical protein [Vibrio casei]|uniref:N-acetyltransferase n=1 Tax=Vibrio casei TaxID=673372 RepID=A0A368LFH9_9VIBR|nr:hypothetical protein [Vibrio casei]RCS68327.1 N-acetyltransferase [Vibrio casei]RCS68642.1 N-acetyltransferase [Vibrio casei]SJN16174.1 hypothetical protein FM109_00480 [Vibrio casei]
METGYEDIYADEPYFDIEVQEQRVLLHMLYVPPHKRKLGLGHALFLKLLSELPPTIEYIRLRSAELGSGCTMSFWQSLGFTSAYTNCDPEDEGKILHLAVNGFALPPVEALCDNEERHHIFD